MRFLPLQRVVFALGCLLAVTLHAAEIAEPQPIKSLTYKKVGNVELKLHVFQPADMKPGVTYPAVVMFFGGGWKSGSPSQFYQQCAYFAERGMIAISAGYRTETKNQTSPRECVMDAKSCMRWVRGHAAELQIDPHHIAAGGGSAGAHLAAATATLSIYDEAGEDTSVTCRPDALVLFNPVIDNGPEGYGYDRVKDYYQDFSPLHNLRAGLPPTLFMLGTKDALIPVETAVKYQAQSEKAGGRCDVKLYSGQPHGFFNYKDGKNIYYDQSLQDADAFLVSLGYLAKR